MARKRTRRQFIQQSAAAGVGFWVGERWLRGEPAVTRSANEKVNVAVVGCAGQGQWNTEQLAASGMANLVAFVDVDEAFSAVTREKFPKVPYYHDYRKVIDRKEIDAVLVATPDHSHAGPTLMALRANKHVYCEKPLAHTIGEARLVRETAAKVGVATQMGTQIHARDNYRRVIEIIQSGVIGEIREVHTFCSRYEWGEFAVPKRPQPIPRGLHYDLWLGPAQKRPYHEAYLPQRWRGWWDFGGGILADMACHHMDLPFWALGIRTPKTVEAFGNPVARYEETCPTRLRVKYEFEAVDGKPPVTLTWYHGKENRPPHFYDYVAPNMPEWWDGSLLIGSDGMMLANYGQYKLLPEEKFKDYKPPTPSIPSSPGHHIEWLQACKGGKKALCNFDYAGPLSEAVLLGNVAFRASDYLKPEDPLEPREPLQWDAKNMRAINAPEADQFIHKEYRKGWELA